MKVEKTQYTHKKVKINSMYEYIFQFKKFFPILLISCIVSSTIMFLTSLFMKIIFDQIIPGALSNTLTALLVGFIALVMFGIFNTYFRNYIIYKISLQISMEITEKFNNKLKETEFINIRKLKSSDILRRAAFIEPLSLFLSTTLFSIFTEAITGIISMSILIWIDVQLFMVTLVFSMVLIIIAISSQIILKRNYSTLIKAQINQASINLDVINNLKRMRILDTKQMFSVKQSKALYKTKKQDKKIWNINNIFWLLQAIIKNAAPLLIIALATHSVMKNQMSLGTLILFVSTFSFFVEPICSITNIFLKYPLVKKEMDMLLFVLQMPNEKINPKGAKLETIKTIQLKNICFDFEKGLNIINIENFLIKNHLILTGANGTGKSTLLNIISTIYHVPGLHFNKIETKYYDLNSVRNSIFFISPNTYIPQTTLFNYITDGNAKKEKTFIENISRFKLENLFDLVGITLEQKMFNNASNFSSGQRQVIQLLPLFAKEYKLILLDEAFENIDKKILKEIIELIRQQQKSALFIEISHSSHFVQKGKKVPIETFK